MPARSCQVIFAIHTPAADELHLDAFRKNHGDVRPMILGQLDWADRPRRKPNHYQHVSQQRLMNELSIPLGRASKTGGFT